MAISKESNEAGVTTSCATVSSGVIFAQQKTGEIFAQWGTPALLQKKIFKKHVTPQANFDSTDIAAVNSVDLKLFYERRTQSPMNEEPLILSLSTLQMIDATYTSIAGCR